MIARLRIGLAGLGVHGLRYATHLLQGEVPAAVLAACSRSDEARGREFAARNCLRFVHDPVELATLAGLDAVVVVLRPDLHPAVAGACLEAGRPVLVEKPLAPDVRSAAALARRALETGTPLMVAQTLRFDPLVRKLRELAASIGPLRIVAINQRFEPSDRPWIDEPRAGGCVLNTGVHGFDLLRFLTGAEAVSVQAETGRSRTRATEDEYAAIVRMEPGGILATLDNARTTEGRSGRVEIAGEKAQVRGDHVHRTLHRIEGRVETDLGRVPAVPTVVETLRRFARSVVAGFPPPVPAADGLGEGSLAEAAPPPRTRGVERGNGRPPGPAGCEGGPDPLAGNNLPNREGEDRNGEREADPEAPGHVVELGVSLLE